MTCCARCAAQGSCGCGGKKEKPKRLSPADEKLLLEAVEKTSALVESSNADPTTALAKVGRQLRLTPDFLKLVGYAYNAGATTEHRLANSHILDKMATIPLADVDAAIRLVYQPDWPEKEASDKQHKPSDYWVPWDLIKGEPYVDLDRVQAESHLRKAAQHYRSTLPKKKQAAPILREDPYKTAELCKRQEALWQNICAVSDQLSRSIAAGDCTVDEYKQAMSLYYGKPGELAAEVVVKAACLPEFWLKHFKRARWGASRLGLSHPLIKNSAEMIQLAKSVVRGKAPKQEQPKQHTKRSNLLNFLTAGLLGKQWAAVTAMENKNPLQSKVQDMKTTLDYPGLKMQRREIRNRSVLYNLMANDEVISQYDPEEVIAAYNEIAQLMPRAAGQPAMIRALLRKRLSQGAAEPFEAAQATQVEKHLWKRTAI